MKKRLMSVLLIGCMLSLLLACTAQETAQTGSSNVVAFVPKLTGNAFFEAANQGAQEYAQKQGFTVVYKGHAVADVANQIAIVESLIADKVKAICISALDDKALDEVLKKARDAGIAVVTWDADVSGDARSLMVSQGTPEQLGKMLVEMGAKSLQARGVEPSQNEIRYAWHYSQANVADQNSWCAAGEAYIQKTYSNWVNVAPENYFSQQDAEKALSVGNQILDEHPDIDLIICNDSTALPAQAEALGARGLTAQELTVTGFASPNAMREYCKAGIVTRWGLWDCKVQGALGCYLANYLAQGHAVKVGSQIDVPDIGLVEVMPNSVLTQDAYTASDSGTVLLPTRTEFTIDNVDQYDF